jgi:hypothetical protein
LDKIGALFYLMGFFHCVAPAVMTEELMRGSNINAAALGNLSAFYFYSYVAMLLVTGFSSGCIIITFAFAKESVPPIYPERFQESSIWES